MINPVSVAVEQRIADNWRRVQDDVGRACRSVGRDPGEVTIVGVTKYVDDALTQALFRAGCRDLGENRPQTLWQKARSLAALPIRWHLIGHLQRNKARRSLPLLYRLHSLDSLRLAQAVSDLGVELDCITQCLVEVNISGDRQKHGFDPETIDQVLPELAKLPNLQVRGLMGMASLEQAPAGAAGEFQSLRLLRDRLTGTTGLSLPELSMGMSGDFEAAIEQGTTHVRIGSRLFEGVI